MSVLTYSKNTSGYRIWQSLHITCRWTNLMFFCFCSAKRNSRMRGGEVCTALADCLIERYEREEFAVATAEQ